MGKQKHTLKNTGIRHLPDHIPDRLMCQKSSRQENSREPFILFWKFGTFQECYLDRLLKIGQFYNCFIYIYIKICFLDIECNAKNFDLALSRGYQRTLILPQQQSVVFCIWTWMTCGWKCGMSGDVAQEGTGQVCKPSPPIMTVGEIWNILKCIKINWNPLNCA